MSNPWEDFRIEDIASSGPDRVVDEVMSPVDKMTDGKIKHRLHRVSYFPEEVVSRDSSPFSFARVWPQVEPKPHPEFGYDPGASRVVSESRFRSLYCVEATPKRIEYELFKFKYPTLFYPVTIYCERDDYDRLTPYFGEGNQGYPVASDPDQLRLLLQKIVRSESFKKLVQYLYSMAG